MLIMKKKPYLPRKGEVIMENPISFGFSLLTWLPEEAAIAILKFNNLNTRMTNKTFVVFTETETQSLGIWLHDNTWILIQRQLG